MSNFFGHSLKITSFGESHGLLIGVIIDGFPSNFEVNNEQIQTDLNRRKPGQSAIGTQRQEEDVFEISSGVFNNKTTGAPICISIKNKDAQSKDYEKLKNVFRPGHADKVYQEKYKNRDFNGGGRSSARVTAAWVAAGALAKQYLIEKYGIKSEAVVSSIKSVGLQNPFEIEKWDEAENNVVRCPDKMVATEMINLIQTTMLQGDTLGGVISARIVGCPIGLGEPVFDKLNADIAKAMFSINAVKGVEFGSGFATTLKYGSENNDGPITNTNNDGGITAGISNGKNIEFNIAFKPTSSIKKIQIMETMNDGNIPISVEGRHDPCVLPRAVPIVESMAALVILDHLLLNLKYS